MTDRARRRFLRTMLAAAGGASVASASWVPRLAVASTSGPFGPLGPADANGWALPVGFSSRVIATTGEAVAGTAHVWHGAPDGGACFATPGGGWIYVSNAEIGGGGGGVGAVEFAPDGTIVDARTVLSSTSYNCAGGPTPWGTWLSCEEFSLGRVFECDPTGVAPAVELPALGRFQHEAAAVDPVAGHVYLTEDRGDGCLYRFVPDAPGDLTAGTLQVLHESLTWVDVPDPTAGSGDTRYQVVGVARFAGGEGAWFADGQLWFTTKGDDRVWRLVDGDPVALEVVYDRASASPVALGGVDGIVVDGHGSVYVAEDDGNMEVCVLVDGGAVPVARLHGVTGSELTGVAFSPDGSRLYVSSQRNPGRTYEITGLFEPPPPFTCEMTVEPDGSGVLSWTDQRRSPYYVRRRTVQGGQTNEVFVAQVDGLSLPVADPSGTWTVRYWDAGTAVDTSCEGPAPTFVATMEVLGDGSGRLSWTDEGQTVSYVRRRVGSQDSYVGSTSAFSLDVPDPTGTWTVRFWRDGQPVDAVAEGPTFTCWIDVEPDGSGLLGWDPHPHGTTYIRRSIDGQETYVGATTGSSYAVPDPAGTWIVRYWVQGTAVDASCSL